MTRASRSLEARFVPASARVDVSAARAVLEAVQDLRALGPVDRDAAMEAVARLSVRFGAASEPGRVAVLDLRRARTRRFRAAFVVGLEEGSLPGASAERQVLDADAAEALGVSRPDAVEVERHLFTIACTRPWERLALARQAATEEGKPLEPSPFWAEVVRVLGDHAPGLVRRRGLADVSYALDDAPSDRERLRALARSLRDDAEWATAVAAATGWERQLVRAASATRRDSDVQDAELRAGLAETDRFSVTELEKYVDCSSMWFVERVLDPRQIDFELDARTRGSIAHATLARFYAQLPAEVGVERLSRDDLPAAYALMRRCLGDALAGQKVPDSVAGKELARALERDLDAFLREEADLALPLVPRRYEVRFGSPMSAPGLKEGLAIGDFHVSGQIDRIDVDPAMSPRGLVWDYKSGAGAHSAVEMDREGRLQIPLYILALRDLLGMEPVGGMYRALAGKRAARGLVLAGEVDSAGLAAADVVDADAFWAQIARAQERAEAAVAGMRAGRVRHDPRWGECPSWCTQHAICRVAAAVSDRFNAEQREAVDRRGRVFVSAGAGTGKTAVLVERVLRRFRDGTPIDRLLAITFTDRAAAELRRRVREGLELAGEMEQARAVDTAWISTIHRFCLRILRAHAFEAGLDPRFCDRRRRACRHAPPRGVRPRARAVRGGGPRPAARSPRHLWPPPPAPDDARRPRAPSQRRAAARPAAGRALRPGSRPRSRPDAGRRRRWREPEKPTRSRRCSTPAPQRPTLTDLSA